MNADRIVVLDEGRVAGIGRHAELLTSCAVYREIAESQASLGEVA
jgi:ATP-binding cassette subfamily B protein